VQQLQTLTIGGSKGVLKDEKKGTLKKSIRSGRKTPRERLRKKESKLRKWNRTAKNVSTKRK